MESFLERWLEWCKGIRIKYTLNAFTPRNRGSCGCETAEAVEFTYLHVCTHTFHCSHAEKLKIRAGKSFQISIYIINDESMEILPFFFWVIILLTRLIFLIPKKVFPSSFFFVFQPSVNVEKTSEAHLKAGKSFCLFFFKKKLFFYPHCYHLLLN